MEQVRCYTLFSTTLRTIHFYTAMRFMWHPITEAQRGANITLVYLTGWTFPDSVGSFFSYVGNSVVPFSMFLIGASFVQNGKKEFFTDIKIYLFMAIKMLLIPIAAAIAIRYIPVVKDWNPTMLGVFILMLSMPVGSMIVMISKQCGADDVEATKGGIFTTLLSVVTIPIVGFFLPM